jgi:hypothetical protein
MRALFDVASWGSSDAYRRLHLANAFEGEVRAWYDEWSLSRPSFTSDELVDNLLLTFAPMIRSAEQEARLKLTSKSYAMRAGESVSAYRSRFEAVLADIPTASQNERMFWFGFGLTERLASLCASDHAGQDFTSYSALVQFAIGQEARALAARQTRTALRSNSAARQDDRDEPAAPPAKKAKVARPAACQAAAAPGASRGGARAGSRPGNARKHGGSGGAGKRLAPPSDPKSEEYKVYYARLVCHGCQQLGHKHEHCPNPSRPWPGPKAGKGQGRAAAAAAAAAADDDINALC